uniref:Calcineurin-like phosphoesterase domain-containing protein n=1 Tax=Plectus sambesii TaxID=2011161 RepID=A0A914WSV0_9BILA
MCRVRVALVGLISIHFAAICSAITERIPVEQPIEIPLSHEFAWKDSKSVANQSFLNAESSAAKASDFYQIFTGDTQYYFPCTPENDECAKLCNEQSKECVIKQARYSNKVQRQSIGSLIKQLAAVGHKPRSIIINGDLTDYGHPEELNAFKVQWEQPIDGVRMFPGLGNHDIQNNIEDCAMNHCGNRMMRYFISYLGKELNIRADYRQTNDFLFAEYQGSFAYSWNECSSTNSSQCVHFVQLNNHPTYERSFEFPIAKWIINSTLEWLSDDLAANVDHPVVINFHRYDEDFPQPDRLAFRDVISNQGSHILAIVFAHFHSSIGVKDNWCINGRNVPLMFSGSVPGNNYLLIRFADDYRSLANVYSLHATGSNQTIVTRLNIATSCS